jgi:hypothetical protein
MADLQVSHEASSCSRPGCIWRPGRFRHLFGSTPHLCFIHSLPESCQRSLRGLASLAAQLQKATFGLHQENHGAFECVPRLDQSQSIAARTIARPEFCQLRHECTQADSFEGPAVLIFAVGRPRKTSDGRYRRNSPHRGHVTATDWKGNSSRPEDT